MDPIPDDRPWDDLHGVLEDDILTKFKEIGSKVYPHQYEFIKYCLGQNIKDQNPILGLRSQTGSGKTLCFQALIYQSYQSEKHKNYAEMKQIKQKDNTIKDIRVLYPYTIVLGQTVYLKQHEENFIKSMPERLGKGGLKFQTFFALTKNQQFKVAENMIENAEANVLLCHPSKAFTGIKNRNINVGKLKYLIIDEADQLLERTEQNEARNETAKILSFILGQTQNQDYQIIFVSASLKEKDIEEFVRECVQMNIDGNKKIDPRFIEIEDEIQSVKCEVKMLPANQNEQIAPYTISHMYLDPQGQPEQQLVELIHEIYENVAEAQVMIFFNQKAKTEELKQLLLKNELLQFIVKQDLIVDCTGNTDQVQRETVRKQFKEGVKKILLCTDVLQRGLDFRKVRVIVHYGLPFTPSGDFKLESYFQRSGRTGRAKDEGVVLSILLKEDLDKRKGQLIQGLEQTKSKILTFDLKRFVADLEKVMAYNN